MILIELKAIGINLLFGIFYYIIINTFSLYEVKIKFKIIINILYFVLTVFCGIVYIVYLDLILFTFNFYYLLIIMLGFFMAEKNKYLKTEKYIVIFNYLFQKSLFIIKKVFLFLINYSFWTKIKIKKKIKDN